MKPPSQIINSNTNVNNCKVISHLVFLLSLILLYSCAREDEQRLVTQRVGEPVILELERIIESSSAKGKPFKVALLLPTSKNTGAGDIAKSMEDAAHLALFEFNRENFILINYDTKGEPETTKNNIELAMKNGAEIIIGPFFASTTKAAAEAIKGANVPIISFTSDARVLGKGVYANSYMVQSEIHRMAKYALQKGMKRFAMIIPDSDFGDLAVKYFSLFIQKGKGEIVLIQRYDNNLQSRINAAKATGQAMYEAFVKEEPVDGVFVPDGKNGLRIVANELLYHYNTAFEPKEDEDNKKLRKAAQGQGNVRQLQIKRLGVSQQGQKLAGSIAGLLGKDKRVNPEDIPKYQLMGIGTWNDKKLLSEPSMEGSWFAMPPRQRRQRFQKKFKKFFGYTPHRIASLAYDTVALAIVMSSQVSARKTKKSLKQLIENRDGFNGVNGHFKFLKTGETLRSLDVYEVGQKGETTEISKSAAILY